MFDLIYTPVHLVEAVENWTVYETISYMMHREVVIITRELCYDASARD